MCHPDLMPDNCGSKMKIKTFSSNFSFYLCHCPKCGYNLAVGGVSRVREIEWGRERDGGPSKKSPTVRFNKG